MPIKEKTLDAWLDETEGVRSGLLDYSRSPMPKDAAERAADIETAIANAETAGNMLADAEQFLTHVKAQAMFAALDKFPDMTAKEREFVIKDEVRMIQRMVDGLAVLTKTLNSRIFAIQNANRSRL